MAEDTNYKIIVIQDRCKGCGFCVEFCPKKVLGLSDDFNHKGYHFACPTNESDCTNCGLCELICPDFALRVSDSTDDAKSQTA